MDTSDQFTAVSWFIAGYLEAAEPPLTAREGQAGAPDRDQIETALHAAEGALQKHGNGICLSCGRGGVVLMDGYFCERCYPETSQVIES